MAKIRGKLPLTISEGTIPFKIIFRGLNFDLRAAYFELKGRQNHWNKRKVPAMLATIPRKTFQVNTSILRLIRKDKKKVKRTVVPISGVTTLTGL